jgi:hypothetical protein
MQFIKKEIVQKSENYSIIIVYDYPENMLQHLKTSNHTDRCIDNIRNLRKA